VKDIDKYRKKGFPYPDSCEYCKNLGSPDNECYFCNIIADTPNYHFELNIAKARKDKIDKIKNETKNR